MKTFFIHNIVTITAIFAGAVAGFFYWKFVGCTNGTCLIQSNPYRMTIWAAIMGGLIGNLIQGYIQRKK